MDELSTTYDNSYALVVGIDTYTHAPPLLNAASDAQAIAKVLSTRYTFTEIVTLIDKDATQDHIEEMYEHLCDQTKPNDRLFVYWAGHGIGIEGQHQSEGFLLACDSITDYRRSLIRMRDFVDTNYIKAKHILIVLDTCHSGYAVTYNTPRAVNNEKNPQRALHYYMRRKAYQVFSSATSLETATDSEIGDGHTPFTSSVLKALEGDPAARSPVNNLLTASSMAEYVRDRVAAIEDYEQGFQAGVLRGDNGGVFVWDPNDILPDRLQLRLTSPDSSIRLAALDETITHLNDERYHDLLMKQLLTMAEQDTNESVKKHAMAIFSKVTVGKPVDLVSIKSDASVDVSLPIEPETVAIPSGPFFMGSPANDIWRSDDEPSEIRLSLDAYAIGKYPVTVGQFKAFVDAKGYDNELYWSEQGWKLRSKYDWTAPRFWDDDLWTGDEHLPIVGISWYEAYAYTQWLTITYGKTYRLPTEAEWEKAARGGIYLGEQASNPKPKRMWVWGDDEPDTTWCNFNENVGHTSIVTDYAKQAHSQAYGLYNMMGNVSEWCLSPWTNPYDHDRGYEKGNKIRVSVRGCGWGKVHSYSELRCAYRAFSNPEIRNETRGFRVSVL